MRVIFTSVGTAGDVLPLVALAVEMRAHDHQVMFAVPLEQLAYPRQYGFEAVQLGPDLREINYADLRIRAQGQKQAGMYQEALFGASSQILQELQEVCRNADVLISAASMRLSRIVHDLTGIPFVSVHYSFPRDYGKRGTRAYEEYASAEENMKRLSDQLNEIRGTLGLAPIRNHSRSPQLALYAMSHVLLPFPEGDLKPYQVVGSFFFDDSQWHPDHDLEAFLQAGPAPLVVSLSSMVHEHPETLTKIFLEAIQRTGHRAIIQSGWSGLAKDMALPDMVYHTGFVPHSWLLPRSVCILHHGGAGTTIAALRAGIPSVTIPHAFDQFALSQRLLDLHCASAMIPLSELTVENLCTAIFDACSNTDYRTRAINIGKQIDADPGTTSARMYIERLAHSKHI